MIFYLHHGSEIDKKNMYGYNTQGSTNHQPAGYPYSDTRTAKLYDTAIGPLFYEEDTRPETKDAP